MLETERLLLRQWHESDISEFISMNKDPEVMRYFPKPLSDEESKVLADKISSHISDNGWGLWAVEVKGQDSFIGFVGLSPQDLGFEWTPCIEIGWRLKRSAWNHGFATEAAIAVLDFGINNFGEIYSYTAADNIPSQNVMKRIGMSERPELFFDHPRVDDPRLKSHVVYSSRNDLNH